jgi:DNA adenine methylase
VGLCRLRDCITFIEGDALAYLEDHLDDKTITFFIAPPYTAPGKSAGKRLHCFFDIDHDRLYLLAWLAAFATF